MSSRKNIADNDLFKKFSLSFKDSELETIFLSIYFENTVKISKKCLIFDILIFVLLFIASTIFLQFFESDFICLISVNDELSTKDIYGKIITQTKQENYVIRFTSVPPEISSFFHAFRLHALNESSK